MWPRCFTKFVHEYHLTGKKTIRVATTSGIIEVNIQKDHQVRVIMEIPELGLSKTPFLSDQKRPHFVLDVNGEPLKIYTVSMCNLHTVLQAPTIDSTLIATPGPAIEQHPFFPSRLILALWKSSTDKKSI